MSTPAVTSDPISACRRQTSIQTRSGSSSGFEQGQGDAERDAPAAAVLVAQRVDRRGDEDRDLAQESSLTTGTASTTAMAMRRRSSGRRARVSTVIPMSRTASSMRSTTTAAVWAGSMASGMATRAHKRREHEVGHRDPVQRPCAPRRRKSTSAPNDSGARVATAARPMIAFSAARATRNGRPP